MFLIRFLYSFSPLARDTTTILSINLKALEIFLLDVSLYLVRELPTTLILLITASLPAGLLSSSYLLSLAYKVRIRLLNRSDLDA